MRGQRSGMWEEIWAVDQEAAAEIGMGGMVGRWARTQDRRPGLGQEAEEKMKNVSKTGSVQALAPTLPAKRLQGVRSAGRGTV